MKKWVWALFALWIGAGCAEIAGLGDAPNVSVPDAAMHEDADLADRVVTADASDEAVHDPSDASDADATVDRADVASELGNDGGNDVANDVPGEVEAGNGHDVTPEAPPPLDSADEREADRAGDISTVDASDGSPEADTATRPIVCPAGPSFVKLPPVNTGSTPYLVRSGDFNGDGHLDIAVPNLGDNTLSVLLGDGKGAVTNAPGSPYAIGYQPCWEAIGDFTGDGLSDVAAANVGASVSILLGRRAGPMTVPPGTPFAIAGQPSAVAVGDFNGDHKLDLVIPVGGSLYVLLGDGQGRFTVGSSLTVPGTLQRVIVADFNRDGLLDVAASNYTANVVHLFLGDGHGGFSSAAGSPWPVSSSPVALAASDFNQDGKMDLAVTSYGGGDVTILLGNGSGGFASALGSPTLVGTDPADLATGDFDGDGHTDLAVTVNGDSVIRVFRGNGAGGFTEGTGSPINVGPYPGSLTAGDFNEDGKLDIAFTNNVPGTWTVSLLLNTCTP